MSANRIDLARVLVDDLARALNNCLSQIELLTAGDPGTVTRQIHQHAQSALATLKHTLSEHDREHREGLRTGAIKPVSVDSEPAPTHAQADTAGAGITLSAGEAFGLLSALNDCLVQVQLATEPSDAARQADEQGRAMLTVLNHHLASLEAGNLPPNAERVYAAEVMASALETFGGPLRLATICLEEASDADLEALDRLQCLDLATAVDDWKTRAESRMVQFEREGKS